MIVSNLDRVELQLTKKTDDAEQTVLIDISRYLVYADMRW
jgi:hypothetical protein